MELSERVTPVVAARAYLGSAADSPNHRHTRVTAPRPTTCHRCGIPTAGRSRCPACAALRNEQDRVGYYRAKARRVSLRPDKRNYACSWCGGQGHQIGTCAKAAAGVRL